MEGIRNFVIFVCSIELLICLVALKGADSPNVLAFSILIILPIYTVFITKWIGKTNLFEKNRVLSYLLLTPPFLYILLHLGYLFSSIIHYISIFFN
jgi:hypothetical protein